MLGLLFNVPLNDFSVMLGWSHCFLGIYQCLESLKCLAQGYYTAVVGFEPWTMLSGVRRSTTEPPCPPQRLVIAQLISAFVYVTYIVHSLFFLNTKFQASSHLLFGSSGLCGIWSETVIQFSIITAPTYIESVPLVEPQKWENLLFACYKQRTCRLTRSCKLNRKPKICFLAKCLI